MPSLKISSSNYSGETADITFSAATGGTEVITGATIPYTKEGYYYGDYDIFITSYDKTCSLNYPLPPRTYTMYFGNTNGTTLYYSDDFPTFSSTTQTIGNVGIAGGIEYSPTLDIWVMSDRNAMWWSEDGLSYTKVSFGSNSRYGKPIWIEDLGTFFAAGDRSNYVALSSDGKTWSQAGSYSFGDLGDDVYGYDPESQLIILSDNNGDIWTSPNGSTWTLRYSPAGERVAGLTIHDGRTSVIHPTSNKVIYSDDGINWSAGTISNHTGGNAWGAVVMNSGRRVITGAGSTGYYYSDDGITYTGVTGLSGNTETTIGALYNEVDDQVVVSLNASSPAKFAVSDDGINWTTEDAPSNELRIRGIKYSRY